MNWNKFLPCILLSSLLGACSGKGEQPNVEPITLCLTDSLLRIVSVDTVHVRDVIDELTLNGRVTFNQDQVANVYPMFGGTVTELHAEIGDFVHKGEVLAVIRSGEVADYEKQLKEAEQQLLLARRNMNATQDMYTSGMASDKDVLQAKQELTSAERGESRKYSLFITSPEMLFISLSLPCRALLLRSRSAGICSCAPIKATRCLRFPVCGMYGLWRMCMRVISVKCPKELQCVSLHWLILKRPLRVALIKFITCWTVKAKRWGYVSN